MPKISSKVTSKRQSTKMSKKQLVKKNNITSKDVAMRNFWLAIISAIILFQTSLISFSFTQINKSSETFFQFKQQEVNYFIQEKILFNTEGNPVDQNGQQYSLSPLQEKVKQYYDTNMEVLRYNWYWFSVLFFIIFSVLIHSLPVIIKFLNTPDNAVNYIEIYGKFKIIKILIISTGAPFLSFFIFIIMTFLNTLSFFRPYLFTVWLVIFIIIYIIFEKMLIDLIKLKLKEN